MKTDTHQGRAREPFELPSISEAISDEAMILDHCQALALQLAQTPMATFQAVRIAARLHDLVAPLLAQLDEWVDQQQEHERIRQELHGGRHE